MRTVKLMLSKSRLLFMSSEKITSLTLLTLFGLGFFRAAHGWREWGKKAPPLHKVCHTDPTMMKLARVIT